MLLESKNITEKEKEVNFYVSSKTDDKGNPLLPHIVKTEYFSEKESLLVFFIKERYRRNKDNTYFLNENKQKIKDLVGEVYQYMNIDNNLYEDFKKSESQGSYINKNFKNNPKIYVSGNFKLQLSEVNNLIEEWKNKIL